MGIYQTYGEQLTEVQTAIKKVLAGQRYEINGRSMWRADLEYLHKREMELQTLVENRGADTVTGTTVQRGSHRVSFTDG